MIYKIVDSGEIADTWKKLFPRWEPETSFEKQGCL